MNLRVIELFGDGAETNADKAFVLGEILVCSDFLVWRSRFRWTFLFRFEDFRDKLCHMLSGETEYCLIADSVEDELEIEWDAESTYSEVISRFRKEAGCEFIKCCEIASIPDEGYYDKWIVLESESDFSH